MCFYSNSIQIFACLNIWFNSHLQHPSQKIILLGTVQLIVVKSPWFCLQWTVLCFVIEPLGVSIFVIAGCGVSRGIMIWGAATGVTKRQVIGTGTNWICLMRTSKDANLLGLTKWGQIQRPLTYSTTRYSPWTKIFASNGATYFIK